MLNSLQNGGCSLILTTSLVHTITTTIFTKNSFSTSVNFHLPTALLLIPRIIHTNPIDSTYLYTSAIFHLLIFVRNNSGNQHQKYFPYLNHLANQGCAIRTRELESLVTTKTVWFFPFFLKIWKVIMELTFTDILLLSLRKLVYCRQQSLMKMLAIGMGNHPIHLFSSYLNLLSLFSHLTNTITRTHVLQETSWLT